MNIVEFILKNHSNFILNFQYLQYYAQSLTLQVMSDFFLLLLFQMISINLILIHFYVFLFFIIVPTFYFSPFHQCFQQAFLIYNHFLPLIIKLSKSFRKRYKKNMQDQIQKNNNLQIYGHQVSGKAPKFTDKTSKFIYKKYSQNEANFYLYLNSKDSTHCSYHLRKYIPQFNGIFTQSEILNSNQQVNQPNQNLENVKQIVEQSLSIVQTAKQRKQWIDHINCRSNLEKNQKFIKLKNLTYNFGYPNIIDLKLGIKTQKKSITKYLKNTTLSHKFRINGLSVRQFDKSFPKGIQRFMSKYYCQQISSEEMCQHLGFFLFSGQKIQLTLLDRIIQQLKQIVLGFKVFCGIRFMSSSVYIAYDAYDIRKFTINFIDFDKYQHCQQIDHTVEEGLINCLKFFIKLKQQAQPIALKLRNKSFKYFNTSHQVIPQHIKNKYQ